MKKKTPKKPEQPEVIETIDAPHKFTDPERLELANTLAQATQKLTGLEEDKKRITSDFKAQIDGEQARANSVATKLNNGYELRQTECRLLFFPKKGVKQYYRLDNGELVKEATMSSGDFQLSLPVKEPKPGEPIGPSVGNEIEKLQTPAMEPAKE